MASVLTALHLIVFALAMIHLMARGDLSAQTRLAWILALFFLPVAGLLLYIFYGEIRFRGPTGDAHVAAEHAARQMSEESGEPVDAVRDGQVSALASAFNGFGITRGNRAELLEDPDGQRERLIADLDAATRSIHLFYYIWLDDRTGRSTAEALIRAAQRGVKVRVGVDKVGSFDFIWSDTWRRMNEAGIETTVALRVDNVLVSIYTHRPDLRNHRKITVIDGRICHCGSQNCADPEFSPKPKYAPWIDIMVRFEGPVARQMDLLFAQTWFEDKPIDLSDWQYETPPFPDGISAQVVGTGPTTPKGLTSQLFSRLIGEARREIIITTPYFAPGEVIVNAMSAAAVAGIDVILNVPARDDSGLVGPACRSNYPRLLLSGVRIFEYTGGLLHSKILTIDGETTFFGATNLDVRSLDLNFENNILFRDRNLTGDIRQRQLSYVASSQPVDTREVARWPFWKRIWYNCFTIIEPFI